MTTDARPACKEFRPHLLAVLADLSGGKANVAVEMTSTFHPVCERLGIAEDEFGNSSHGTLWTHRQISLSMRALRKATFTDSKRKGFWEITELGLRAVREGFKHVSDEPDPEDGEEEDEEALAPVIRLPLARSRYDEDAYLRALAVHETPCYGTYHPKSDACGGCLLAVSCVDALDARLAEIAAELDLEDAKLRASAKAQKRSRADQTASVDELLKLDDAGHATAVARSRAANWSEVTSPREQTCVSCGGTIPERAKVVWIPDVGVFHRECVPKDET